MRIALGIEYDGTDFFGWQAQAHGPSVQATLEQALSFVADQAVVTLCAGRTDAGVHARCQVVHFDTTAQRDQRAWILGANSRLPGTVAVTWARPVADEFHARYSAVARRYRYRVLNRPVRSALDARQTTWERKPLDVERMRAATPALLGRHDFSAFRTIACQSKTPIRQVHEISIVRQGDCIDFEIEANAFLHHMVRNIVGSLLIVGRGDAPPEWLAELLLARDRSRAGPTAAASGLFFLQPFYPPGLGLPAVLESLR